MESNQDIFQNCFDSFAKDYESIVGSYDRLNNFVKESEAKASGLRTDDPVVSSEYYFLESFACLGYMVNYGFDKDVFSKGNDAIHESLRLLPDDREYNLYSLVYTIFNVDPEGGERSYRMLKDIYKECPSFRLLEKNLISANWSEDVFNALFSRYLVPTVDNMMHTSSPDLCIEACTLLTSMPDTAAKLKAYTYLSRLLYDAGNAEEALRNARLGVELLGSSHEYDFRDESSILWAECWTRVATCNRQKKEYDFAMSLYEKGASNGIVECIHFLGEMYEKGESEDVDLKMANELYDKAKNLKEERERILREEKERAEREIREREEKARAEKERVEREEALAALKAKNKRSKSILSGAIGLLAFYCLCVVVFLLSHNVKDKIYDYEKKGVAVLAYDDNASDSYIICMDTKAVYMDDMKKVVPILDVANPNPAKEIRLTDGKNGLAVSVVDGSPMVISSSKELNIRKTHSPDVFIVTKYFGDMSSVTDGYVLKLSSDKGTLLNIKNADVNYEYVEMNLTGDMTDIYGKTLKSSFSSSEMNLLKTKGISTFKVRCKMYFENLSPVIDGNAYFDKLMLSFAPKDLGTKGMMSSFAKDASILLGGGLTQNILSKIFNVTYTLDSHRSSDGKSTFVIKKDGDDKHDTLGLFIVDNDKRTYRCIDHGMNIDFQPSRIQLTKYGRFLLVFSANSNVYYDYSGNKI